MSAVMSSGVCRRPARYRMRATRFAFLREILTASGPSMAAMALRWTGCIPSSLGRPGSRFGGGGPPPRAASISAFVRLRLRCLGWVGAIGPSIGQLDKGCPAFTLRIYFRRRGDFPWAFLFRLRRLPMGLFIRARRFVVVANVRQAPDSRGVGPPSPLVSRDSSFTPPDLARNLLALARLASLMSLIVTSQMIRPATWTGNDTPGCVDRSLTLFVKQGACVL